MSSQATRLLDQYEKQAKDRAVDSEVLAFAKKSHGELEKPSALGIAVLEASGWELNASVERMLKPEVSLMIETTAERVVQALYARMDFETAESFNESLSALEAVPNDTLGHFALWSFPDGSAWCSFRLHEREIACDAVEHSDFKLKDSVERALWTLWANDIAPLGIEVGAKFREAKAARRDLVALSGAEAKALIEGVSRAWGAGAAWGKGMGMKGHKNRAAVGPVEFREMGLKALDKGLDDFCRAGLLRMGEIRRERETRMKIHWRDAMCDFSTQSQALPVYDAGFASFLMSKPGLFGQYPQQVWKKMFFEIVDLIKPLSEGESPDLESVERAASMLGDDIAAQLAHFLYRYHRHGGAKLMAKQVLEQTRERMAQDAARQGLAASVKTKVVADEARESSKAAGSIEFSTQYGAALALYAALWAKDGGFVDMATPARAVVKTMRGAGEISMECFGWFARLMYEFGEGFVSKEDIAKALQKEMADAARIADEEKRLGGKITIENEWSGNWGAELAGRKVREYLGLERAKAFAAPAKPA